MNDTAAGQENPQSKTPDPRRPTPDPRRPTPDGRYCVQWKSLNALLRAMEDSNKLVCKNCTRSTIANSIERCKFVMPFEVREASFQIGIEGETQR